MSNWLELKVHTYCTHDIVYVYMYTHTHTRARIHTYMCVCVYIYTCIDLPDPPALDTGRVRQNRRQDGSSHPVDLATQDELPPEVWRSMRAVPVKEPSHNPNPPGPNPRCPSPRTSPRCAARRLISRMARDSTGLMDRAMYNATLAVWRLGRGPGALYRAAGLESRIKRPPLQGHPQRATPAGMRASPRGRHLRWTVPRRPVPRRQRT